VSDGGSVDDRDDPLLGSFGGQPTTRPRGFFRRHKALTALGGIVLLVLAVVLGFAVYLNQQIAGIERFDTSLPEGTRPTVLAGRGEELTVLLAGVDARPDTDVSAEIQAGEWSPGTARSDTIMVLHVPADRSAAYVVSIPRDAYVPIYDMDGQRAGTHKINYSFSVYGPNGYLSTVEHLTGVRMDHVAIADWNGFRAITDALGGVRLYIPQASDDQGPDSFAQGWQTLDGEQALRYVRTRYSLPTGDFGRIQRQQNFLRAMMGQVVDEGASANVVKLTNVVEAITSNLTLDSAWTTGDIRSLALSMRGLRPGEISYLTAPLSAEPFRDVPGDGSVVLLDERGLDDLFAAMSRDDMATYVEAHGDELLPDTRSVN